MSRLECKLNTHLNMIYINSIQLHNHISNIQTLPSSIYNEQILTDTIHTEGPYLIRYISIFIYHQNIPLIIHNVNQVHLAKIHTYTHYI